MRLRKRCAAWLGLAGACVFVIGCGGDVPDPASDANAAGGSPGGGGSAPAAAPAPQVAANDAPKAEEAAPAPEKGQEAAEAPKEQPKEAAKGQGGNNSTTSEMLAMAGGSNAPPAGGGASPPPAGGGASPQPSAPGGPNTPGTAPGGGAPGGGGPGAPGVGPGPPGPGGRPTMGPGSAGMQGQNADPSKMMGDMMKNQQKQMQRGGPAGAGGRGGPGMAAGGGAPGGGGPGQGPGAAGGDRDDDGPVNVNTPEGAVKSFLSALKARNADRLSESTALRAARDSAGKNQEMFDKIIKVTISDSELDDLAKKMEGYQIAGENPQTSTGRVDVVVQKSGQNGTYYKRKITARREKKGWGVLDIGPEQPFRPLGAVRRPKMPSR